MTTGILFLHSLSQDKNRLAQLKKNFINACLSAFGCREITDKQIDSCDYVVVMILTGGTENTFLQLWSSLKASNKPFIIASSETDNSLPAAVEILSWLRQNEPDCKTSIVHGSFEAQAQKIQKLVSVDMGMTLEGQTIGVIGGPSKWLIASAPDYAKIEENTGAKILTISMEEFETYIKQVEEDEKKEFASHFIERKANIPEEEILLSGKIYAAIKRLIASKELTAVTLKCFDLLSTHRTTGCLALAQLNDEGIPAACEGDVPALISMMIVKEALRKTCFMANVSSIRGSVVTFAHCSCPTSILNYYHLDTHFESGIGVSVAGEFQERFFTMLRVDPVNKCYVMMKGESMEHKYSPNLCRTQLKLDMPGVDSYFFNKPLGNHHILILGDQMNKLQEWFYAEGYTRV
jgi:L-fucose isomerase-like protein